MRTITLPSPAKLNLFLHILERREDGYHNLQTVFQFINFCDQLQFNMTSDRNVTITPTLIQIPLRKNLIYRAAMLLKKETGYERGVDIVLHKHLPFGAGIGGGSSNAATTLVALNKLWKLGLSQAKLLELGAQLGADVPIFIYGQTSWAEGIGNEFTPIVLPQPWYLLLMPKCHVTTAALFEALDVRDSERLSIESYTFGQGKNDFEPIVRAQYPEVDEAMRWLEQYGEPRLTGTGAIVYLKFDTEQEAGRIAALTPDHISSKVVRGLNKSPLIVALEEVSS